MNTKQRPAAGGRAAPSPGAKDETALRDWFAGQAVAGLLAFSPPGADGNGQLSPADAAILAYATADAMLCERLVSHRRCGE